MREAHFILIAVTAVSLLHCASSQGGNNPCTPHVKCNICIQAGGNCAWCGDENFSGGPRCDFRSNLLTSCQNNISFPISSSEVPPGGNASLGQTVLLSPQSIKLKLRPGRPGVFTLKARPAENYPVDLYYLMDLSASMADDLTQLKILGSGIAQAIDSITTDYRLAFGSFVDKTVSPIVQIEQKIPCFNCEPTYGYHHSLDFTDIAQNFAAEVQKTKTSGNIDNPEGGFDGLMQLAVCETEIGWRSSQNARRLVVYVSDASFHVAGDGKLGGIVTPNDYQCHLAGTIPKLAYSKSTQLDYPSVGLLKKILKEKKIVPILAVTSAQQELYKGLADQWKELGATVGVLAANSNNIVDLIRQAYEKISSTVTLNDNSKNYIQVEAEAQNCQSGTGNVCNGVKLKETVDFKVTVTATSQACATPAIRAESKNFQIQVPAFGDVNVDVEVICDCECEKPPLAIPNSPKCSEGNGTSACGQCNCNPGRFGENCGCTSAESVDERPCRINPNKTEEPLCSGNGNCICGKCECNKGKKASEIISGSHCQCTNFNCDRYQGVLCGGPGRGRCECNKCICEGIYIGSNCGDRNCTKLEPNCYRDGKVCGGHGTCDCGSCNCDKNYIGKHCEECPTCPGQCSKVRECILCALGVGEPAVCANCTIHVIVTNETIQEKCRYQASDDCFYVYTYDVDPISNNITYKASAEKKCFPPVITEPNILAIVLGTIGGIVLAGLIALLLWKLFVSAYDNFEYHKFEKERQKSNWEKAQNPLYKPSKQKYENPAYVGSR